MKNVTRWMGSLCLCLWGILMAVGVGVSHAQTIASATPVRAVIATSTPQATREVLNTPTPTWTPTSEGPVQLTVKADAGEVNVRAEPDPASQRLGSIKAGERYVVRGRYFSWLLFDFPSSPSGTGWVFDGLVDVIGDASKIATLNPYAEPTSAADAEASQTLSVIVQTPGGELTATADARVLVLVTPTLNVGALSEGDSVSGLLPTYTPPAEYNLRVTATVASDVVQETTLDTLASVASQRVPPAMPIVILALVGVLSLAIGFIFRR